MVHQFTLFFLMLVFIVSSFWLFVTMTFHSFDLGENSVRVVKQNDLHEKRNLYLDNSIRIRQSDPTISFVGRVKRETKEIQKKIPNEGTKITKSSRQIQFSTRPYKMPGPINPNQMTGQQQFAQTFSNDALPPVTTFSQFQPSQQQQPIMHIQIGTNNQKTQPTCFMSQTNPPYPNAKPFYCTYIPIPPTLFSAVSGITDFNQALLGSVKENIEQDNLVKDQFPNAFERFNRENNRECPVNFYRCNDGSKCISKLQWCDSKVNCADASDETKCSCRERLSSERLCDNYYDCPHGEDELGCFGCPKNSFSCNDASSSLNKKGNCITQEQRCDGISHCANGKDEELCSILTESYTSGNEMFPVGYNIGFLRRNLRGTWYPVCGHAYKWAEDACTAEFGTLSENPLMEMLAMPNHREIGPFIMQNGNYSNVIPDCPTEIAYARCPTPSSNARKGRPQSNGEAFLSSSRKLNDNNFKGDSNPMVSIVGGHESLPGAWPFIVIINRNGYFHCGGTAINEWWVLCAAHCFEEYTEQYYEIEAGILRRSSFSPTRQMRRIAGVLVHPQFNPDTFINDIALALLSEPLYFNSWVIPARLPDWNRELPGWAQEPSVGSICVAVGWGALEEGGNAPDRLQEVEIPIVPCRHEDERNSAEICAGLEEGGRDSCQGDSGGPLMCRMPDPYGEWYIGGIVSHGIGCGREHEPGAYTKVSHFVDWIISSMTSQAIHESVGRPLTTCPGFSCKQPHIRCLPAEKHCDNVTDCLEAEDETNCSFLRTLWDRIVGQPQKEPNTFDQPQERLSNFAQPQGRLNNFAQPQERLSNFAQPQQRLNNFAQPQERPSNFAQPQKKLGNFAQPQERLSNFAQPQERLSNFAQPQERLSNFAQPQEKLSNFAQPQERLSNFAQPQK